MVFPRYLGYHNSSMVSSIKPISDNRRLMEYYSTSLNEHQRQIAGPVGYSDCMPGNVDFSNRSNSKRSFFSEYLQERQPHLKSGLMEDSFASCGPTAYLANSISASVESALTQTNFVFTMICSRTYVGP